MSSPQNNPNVDGLNLPVHHNEQLQTYIFAAFAAIAWYNAFELVVLCLTTFKRRQTGYFWCLLTTSVLIIPHCLGYVLLFFAPGVTPYFSITLVLIGWCGMVTGHSLVLWSRLHLVLQNPTLLHAVLALIIVDAFLLHVPIIVLLYGAVSAQSYLFSHGYNVMERIQLVWFCCQEAVISGIYVWETTKLLRLRPERPHNRILAQLLIINVLVLILDFAVVGTEFAGYYSLQVMFKPVAYTIKLKLEYAILGRLIQVVKRSGSDLDGQSSSGREFSMLPSSTEGPPATGQSERLASIGEIVSRTPSTRQSVNSRDALRGNKERSDITDCAREYNIAVD